MIRLVLIVPVLLISVACIGCREKRPEMKSSGAAIKSPTTSQMQACFSADPGIALPELERLKKDGDRDRITLVWILGSNSEARVQALEYLLVPESESPELFRIYLTSIQNDIKQREQEIIRASERVRERRESASRPVQKLHPTDKWESEGQSGPEE